MRRLKLIEFSTERGIRLAAEERDSLKRLNAGLKIEPTLGTVDRYDLTPDQRIGLICLPDLVVEIRPKVPLSSVLFLVSYACNAVDLGYAHPEMANDAELTEMLAMLLSKLVEHATGRGLLHGYRSEEESLRGPRGRIRFDEQLRRRFGLMPPVEVQHDVYTTDVTENRVLLAALLAVSKLVSSPSGRRELFRAQRLFGDVSRIHFPGSQVPDIPITRLNRHYEAALELACLVLRSCSLDLGTGGAKGASFTIDMNLVFERFVRTALRNCLGASLAGFPDRPPPLRLDEGGVVPLKPDLCWTEGRHVLWVGDAKYKRLPVGGYLNADLYQLLAYAVALGLPGGTLVYAADQGVRSVEHVVVRSGKRLRLAALDLGAPPAKILLQVNEIAQIIRQSLGTAESRVGMVSPAHASATARSTR